jgi:hypothetical protein
VRAPIDALIMLATALDRRGSNYEGTTDRRTVPSVTWKISANRGRHARPGVDARGWLWEITRGDQVAHVLIEISGTAWSTKPLRLPEDTRQALETDGRTELLKVVDQDDPPRVIRCSSTGCAPLHDEEVSGPA